MPRTQCLKPMGVSGFFLGVGEHGKAFLWFKCEYLLMIDPCVQKTSNWSFLFQNVCTLSLLSYRELSWLVNSPPWAVHIESTEVLGCVAQLVPLYQGAQNPSGPSFSVHVLLYLSFLHCLASPSQVSRTKLWRTRQVPFSLFQLLIHTAPPGRDFCFFFFSMAIAIKLTMTRLKCVGTSEKFP